MMSTQKTVKAIVLAAICQALLMFQSHALCAQEPQGVIRTFGVISLSPIDFQSDESVGLIVAPPAATSGDLLRFHHTNLLDPRFDSTVWEFRQAMHVTQGESYGAFVWLITDETPTPPPIGSVTFSKHSKFQVLSQEEFFIEDCSNSSCGAYDYRTGDVVINDNPSSSVFTVVTAVFSK